MKSLLIALLATASISVYANVNCNALTSNDSVVLCKQNKRILKKLNRLGNANLKTCTVTYCTFQGKVETRAQYTSYCKSYTDTGWALKDYLVEARNMVHAREVFEELNLERYSTEGIMTNAFISADCNL